MSETNSTLAGPRRLILINSGKFDYAEIDLTRSFQLVGANGLGKTALISTLQYLYLDNQRDMRFGKHSAEESRRFYFKGDTSVILYECETALGIRTLCVRSNGPGAAYELERHTWTGEFLREDFVDSEGRPRRWAEVQTRLASRGLAQLADTADLRRLVGAIDKVAKSSWNLVPLAEARDYPRFRQTFQRLLQLHDIHQDDLKSLLAESARLSPSECEVDLAAEYEKELRTIEREKNEIQLLQGAVSKVGDVRRIFDHELGARSVAHSLVRELGVRHADYADTFNRHFTAIQSTKESAEKELARLEGDKETLRQTLQTVSTSIGALRERLVRIRTDREQFANYVADIEEQGRDRLLAEISGIQGRIRHAPKETAETITQRLSEKATQLTQREAKVSRVQEFFITWLRQHLAAAEIDRIGALFHRGVLELIVDEELQIKNEKLLLNRIREAAARCDARGYEDETIAINFPAGAVNAVAQVGSTTALQREVETLKREIQALETDLETIARLSELKARLPVAEEEFKKQSQRILAYENFQKLAAQAPELESQLAHLEPQTATLETKIDENEKQRNGVDGIIQQAIKKFEELKAERQSVWDEAKQFPVAEGEDTGETPFGTAAVPELSLPLPAFFKIAREKCLIAASAASELKHKIELLDRDFSTATFAYNPSSPIEDRLRRLEIEVASLGERSQTAERRWQSVLITARASFRAMLKSLNEVSKAARKLNVELAKIEFSSIAKVSLEIIEIEAAVRDYTRHAEDVMQPSLFETTEDADRKMEQFTELLKRRPKLVLTDLYSLRCEVIRRDGQKNHYEDFDAVESTGTTIVLKVTLNLLVLRDLLIPGKARIPFYLDEVHALDRQNYGNILQLSQRLGFVGIYAAPTAASGPRRYIHLIPDAKGRLVVTPAHQKDILRWPGEG